MSAVCQTATITFLNMGVTKAFLQSSGTWQDDRDYLLLRRELLIRGLWENDHQVQWPCVALGCL